jgi:hypothetical protein
MENSSTNRMPTCKKFFDDLADCLLASECVKTHRKKPTQCLESLLKAKVYDAKLLNDEINNTTTTKAEDYQIDPFAPRECALKHQSYVECKVALVFVH